MYQFNLQPEDNQRLQNLCGCHDENISEIERHFNVQVYHRGFYFKISGQEANIKQATQAIQRLYDYAHLTHFSREDIHHTFLNTRDTTLYAGTMDVPHCQQMIEINKKRIKVSTPNQLAYIKKLQDGNNTVTFATGPAGTGKTFLAVLIALKMLKEERYRRVILTRPVIEAGEQLGFLPGDMMEKTYPYLQPLYDAMYQLLNQQEVEILIEKNIIEIAPLAFMRGRTFNESFMILDESQNTTTEQMKMFLTRIGHHSKVAIIGDDSQMDLTDKQSGLTSAQSILQNVAGIDFIKLQAEDIRRHHIVQLITQAYEQASTMPT